MSDERNRIAQALLQAQTVTPPPMNPYLLNQQLEQAAQPQSPPIHPILGGIMQRMGLLNAIRNRRNAGIVDPEMPIQ